MCYKLIKQYKYITNLKYPRLETKVLLYLMP